MKTFCIVSTLPGSTRSEVSLFPLFSNMNSTITFNSLVVCFWCFKAGFLYVVLLSYSQLCRLRWPWTHRDPVGYWYIKGMYHQGRLLILKQLFIFLNLFCQTASEKIWIKNYSLFTSSFQIILILKQISLPFKLFFYYQNHSLSFWHDFTACQVRVMFSCSDSWSETKSPEDELQLCGGRVYDLPVSDEAFS